jgi:hypothetical protein
LLRVGQTELAFDDFLESNVRETGPHWGVHQRTAALIELPHSFAYNINKHLLIRDMLKGFFEEMAVHGVCVFVRADSENSGVGKDAPTEGTLSNATRGILQAQLQVRISEIIEIKRYQISEPRGGDFQGALSQWTHSPLGVQR